MFNVTAVVLKNKQNEDTVLPRQVKSVPLCMSKVSAQILFFKNYKHN